MLSFLKKSKSKSGGGSHLDEAPKKKGVIYRPRGIETVCPEAGYHQQQFYLSPAQALGERLKDYPLILNGSEDQPTRLQWQFAIAIEAINTLDIYPLQAVVNLHGEDKWDFHRAAYLRALVAGMGDWLNKHQVKNKRGNLIDVLSEGWAAGDSLAPAKEMFIPVSGGITEFQLCSEISQYLPKEYLHPEVYRLFLDSFAPDFQHRNPIAGAMQLAREKVVKRLSAKGIETATAIGVKSTTTNRGAGAASATITTPAPQATMPSQPDTGSVKPESQQAQQKPVAAKKPQAQKQKSTAPTVQAAKKAGIAMPERAQSEPVTHTEPPAQPATPPSELTNISLEDLVGVVRERLAEGIITANQAGAIFHGTPNGAGLIVPKGFDVIAQIMKVDMASVEAFANSHMIDAEHSFPSTIYRLHRPGRGWAKIKVGVLNSQVTAKLFPEGLEANPGIKAG